MLADAVHVPAAVLADEARGAAASASTAQMEDTAAFALTMKPPLLASMNEASVAGKRYTYLTRPLNDREHSSGSLSSTTWARARASMTRECDLMNTAGRLLGKLHRMRMGARQDTDERANPA
jgi:hypothetical protein